MTATDCHGRLIAPPRKPHVTTASACSCPLPTDFTTSQQPYIINFAPPAPLSLSLSFSLLSDCLHVFVLSCSDLSVTRLGTQFLGIPARSHNAALNGSVRWRARVLEKRREVVKFANLNTWNPARHGRRPCKATVDVCGEERR